MQANKSEYTKIINMKKASIELEEYLQQDMFRKSVISIVDKNKIKPSNKLINQNFKLPGISPVKKL